MRRALLVVALTALALPAPALAQGGAAKSVVGGGSFNTAPLLAPGTYSDTVAAGETAYWKVRLAKGQVLRVKATVDTSQIQTDPLADGFDKGLANLNYFLDIFTPLREQLSEESGGSFAAASARLEGSREAGAKTGTATSPRAGLRADPGQRLQRGQVPGAGGVVLLAQCGRHGHLPRRRPGRAARRARGPGHRPGAAVVGRLRQGAARSTEAAARLAGHVSGPERLFAATDQPADPALTLALVAVLALLGGLILGTLAIVVLGLGRRRS